MNKTALIIQREYLTRIRKKSFIIMSILGPLLFAAMFVLPAWFASFEDTTEKNIAVIDYTQKYTGVIEDTEYLKFQWLGISEEKAVKEDYQTKGYDAYIIITDDLQKQPDAVKIYSEAQITIDVKGHIARNLEDFLEQERLESYRIDGLQEIINHINDVNVQVATIKLGEDGSQKESSVEFTMLAAIVFAMLIYFFVIMYGTQVMRGVVEEKTNRIIEVIVSSVKPFQLMMGKIIGIVLVALTQFLIWVVFTFIIITGIKTMVSTTGSTMVDQSNQIETIQSMSETEVSGKTAEFAAQFNEMIENAMGLDLVGTLLAFVFFFIGGYLLYAGLFAAVGAAIDNETESQQFVMPVMMPLILSIYIAMAAFRNPGGDLAFWFSMIPFTSPIVMMARIPFQIPVWEIILSMVILSASFVFTTWFAGRIYRTGILMYGKKVSYKELWKWFRYSGK
ncbi:ABC transporter permease [Marinilabiliaceae bacterium JC017]|nr:ABC transporter permease [Marinilabiliaceae bacterium JC017]